MRTLIIHHNDHDGITAAGVATEYSHSLNCKIDIDYISADYIQPLRDLINNSGADRYNVILLLDYSISTDDNARFICEKYETVPIVWVDHHKSSIDTIKKYPELGELPGLRVIGISGVLLTWLFYYNRLPVQYQNLLQSLNNLDIPVNKDDLDKLIDELKPPKTLVAVHKYDIWDHRDPDTELFHLGYNITDPNEFVSILLGTGTDYAVYEGSVQDGKVIKKYVDNQNKEYRDKCGFKTTIYDKSNDRVYNVFALNTDRTTSLTFGEKMDEYDICMPFYYNGEKDAWSYSLYTNKDDVDCSYIAKALGGGGHKQAAGFSMKTCKTKFDI